MAYVARRIVFYLIAAWAAITLNFAIPRMMPGNPVDAIITKLQQHGTVTPATRHAIEIMLGQGGDQGLWAQYMQYWKNLFTGNLGVSTSAYPAKVSTVIGQSIWWTVGLIGISTCLSFVIGISLGMIAGWKRGTWLDGMIPATTFLAAIPYFWLALILVWVFAMKLGWAPAQGGGYDPFGASPGFNTQFLGSVISHGWLPALTIVLSSIGGWLLGMRNMMVSTMSEDYVLTAKAKGLTRRRVMVRYAARNAVLPSISGFAISLGFIVAGSIVAEQVFSYPGVGYQMWNAVTSNDYTLMQGIFLIITLSVLCANFLVDMLYGLIDPRTRQG